MLFQLCSMSGQVNKQSKSASPHNSDWEENSGPDVAGIYDTVGKRFTTQNLFAEIEKQNHKVTE